MSFACSKHLNIKSEQSIFFQTSFSSTKCAQFLLKLKRILTLMIRTNELFFYNRLELMNYFFITDLNKFGSNMLLTLKIMDSENVTLTKLIHIYVIESMNA